MIKKIVLIGALSVVLASCSDNVSVVPQEPLVSGKIEQVQQVQTQKEVLNLKTVGVSEFKKELEKGDGILIDLRTNGEVAEGVISGAVQIDFYAPDFQNKINSLDKNKKYLIYCRSGSRSGKALGLMKTLGFRNVINLNGGIGAWINSGEKLGVLGEKNEIKTITLEEVQKHNKNEDCWTIIDSKVYDITSFFGVHPGGDGKLEILCGVDGTKDFIGKHGDNAKVQMKKKDFYIGDLK